MRAGAGGRGGARTTPSFGRRGTLQSSVRDSAKVPICLLWVNQVGGTYFLDRLYIQVKANIRSHKVNMSKTAWVSRDTLLCVFSDVEYLQRYWYF